MADKISSPGSVSSQPLPEYDRPPVVEVVLGLSFEPLPAFTAVQMGALWADRFSTEWPKSIEQPPYHPPQERFGRAQGLPAISLELLPPAPRLWLLTEDQTEVIQLQRDWLACNWRRSDIADAAASTPSIYPRFTHVRERFWFAFQAVTEFLQQQNLGDLRPVQCEVAYVNHIRPEGVWESPGELSKVLPTFATHEGARFLPPLEQALIHATYVMNDEGIPVGRLHVQVQPGSDPRSGDPIIVLTLTARGQVVGPTKEAIDRFLSLGHEWIVRGFTELTSKEMREVWRQHV